MMFLTLWQENFLVVKSLMGTPVDWKIFTRNFFFQLRVRAHGGVQLKICFSTIKDLPKWFFSNNGIFLSQNSYGYKTHLYSFRAIFGLKLTKFDLTLEIIIRNRSKAPWKISMIFLTIWKKNFFVAKSHMGTLLEWFFLHKKKISLRFRNIWPYKSKMFRLSKSPSKSCFKLAIYCVAKLKPILKNNMNDLWVLYLKWYLCINKLLWLTINQKYASYSKAKTYPRE